MPPLGAGPDIRFGARERKKETNMSTILRSALVAVALVSSVSATMAAPRYYDGDRYGDAQRYSGSNDADRAFWDAQQSNGS